MQTSAILYAGLTLKYYILQAFIALILLLVSFFLDFQDEIVCCQKYMDYYTIVPDLNLTINLSDSINCAVFLTNLDRVNIFFQLIFLKTAFFLIRFSYLISFLNVNLTFYKMFGKFCSWFAQTLQSAKFWYFSKVQEFLKANLFCFHLHDQKISYFGEIFVQFQRFFCKFWADLVQFSAYFFTSPGFFPFFQSRLL